MGFGDELRQADEQRMNAVFDDIWASSAPATEESVEEFTDTAIELALQTYGILKVIHDRIDEVLPLLHERGVSNENLGGIVTGSNMVIMALAAFADLDMPDTPERIDE